MTRNAAVRPGSPTDSSSAAAIDAAIHARVLRLWPAQAVPAYSTDEDAAEIVAVALTRIGLIGRARLTSDGLSGWRKIAYGLFKWSPDPHALLVQNIEYTWYLPPPFLRTAGPGAPNLSNAPSSSEEFRFLQHEALGRWSAVSPTRARSLCLAALKISADVLASDQR